MYAGICQPNGIHDTMLKGYDTWIPVSLPWLDAEGLGGHGSGAEIRNTRHGFRCNAEYTGSQDQRGFQRNTGDINRKGQTAWASHRLFSIAA
jgi:hypothetical protein